MKAFDTLLSEKKRNIIFFLFLLVYFAFLIFWGYEKLIWEDEAFSLHTSSYSIFKAIHLSYFFEDQPPVYFIILTLWRKLNDSILFARLFSIICTIFSALVLHKLGKLIFPKLYSRWVLVLFFLNPFTVWASIEIRLYSLLICLSFLTIYLFYLIFYYNRHKLKIIFLLISSLGIYTQYYFTLLIIALSILLLFSKGWRPFFNFCFLSAILLVIFLPNLIIIPQQYSMVLHFSHQTKTLFEWIGTFSFSPLQFLFAIFETNLSLAGRWVVLIIFSIFFLYIVSKFYNENKKQPLKDFKTSYELLIPIISILFFFALIFINSGLFYAHRYMSIVYPFFCLLYAILNIFNQKIRTYIFLGVALYYIFVLNIIYRPPFLKFHDHKSVAIYVHQIEHANEPILFRQTGIYLAVKPYYKGKNQLIAVPERKFDYSYYSDDVKDTSELKQLIIQKTANCNSFILVNITDDNYVETQLLSNSLMNRFLINNYKITKDTTINGKDNLCNLRVRYLFKKQNSSTTQ